MFRFAHPCIIFNLQLSKQIYEWFFLFNRSQFWRRLDDGLVPVVFDSHGHYAKVAPPGSFVDASKFDSVADLASHLKEMTRLQRRSMTPWFAASP